MQRLLPLAASIAALLIGFGAGYVSFGDRAGFTPAGEEPRGELYLAALQRALDTPGTGVDQDYADTAAGISGKVTVVGPVATANLGDCREFRHDAPSSGSKTATQFRYRLPRRSRQLGCRGRRCLPASRWCHCEMSLQRLSPILSKPRLLFIAAALVIAALLAAAIFAGAVQADDGGDGRWSRRRRWRQ